jgi:G:T-mismatch repair DNA endonuclease (very short patch repair protein)
MIDCKICGKKLHMVNLLHLRVHKYNMAQYLLEYPGAKTRSDEVMIKISNSLSRSWKNDPERLARFKEYLRTRVNPLKGKTHAGWSKGKKLNISPEGMEALVKSGKRAGSLYKGNLVHGVNKGKKVNVSAKGLESLQKTGKRLGLSNIGRKHTFEARNRMSIMFKGKSYEKIMGKDKALELRKLRSISAKMAWEDPKYIYAHTRNKKPTNPEREMCELLDNILPKVYAYNGNYKLGISIGNRIPDFVNINGKKQVIEVWGDYWHRNHRSDDWVNHYKKFGFDCLVIWENELKNNKDNVQKRILTFEGGS